MPRSRSRFPQTGLASCLGLDQGEADFGRFVRKFSGFYRCNEAISATRQGFNVARSVRGIAKGIPDLLNAVVHALLEVNVGLLTPDLELDLFAGNNLTGLAGEQGENFKRLRRQADGRPELEQFSVTRFSSKPPKRSTYPMAAQSPHPLGTTQTCSRIGESGRRQRIFPTYLTPHGDWPPNIGQYTPALSFSLVHPRSSVSLTSLISLA